MTDDEDRILRSSVPERWKDCTSAIGAVQSYIAELQVAISAIVQAADRVERIYDDGGLALAVDEAAGLLQLEPRPPHPDRPRGK